MGDRSLRTRLRTLERTAKRQAEKDEYQLMVIQVDEDGRVLDDGTDEVRPWVGQLASEVPGIVVKCLSEASMAEL